jgi:hypothetical protein
MLANDIQPLNDKRYTILTGYDGALDGDTSIDDVRALAAGLAADKPVAIHLHGGLVSKTDALRAAARLLPEYTAAGVHPIFVFWQTCFLETLKNRLKQVWNEGIFDALVKRLLPHVVGALRLPDGPRSKGPTAVRPNDVEVADEYDKRKRNEEPFGAAPKPGPGQVAEVTPEERREFEAELESDPEFQKAAEEVVQKWSAGDPEAVGLMSPRVLGEAPGANRSEDRPKGFLSTAALVYHAGAVLVRVVSRFRKGRDHGVYATVVEEVLREFYVGAIGAELWGRMKRQAERAFRQVPNVAPPGGWLLLDLLARRFQGGGPPLSIVAHSAGAVYACRLLRHVREQRGRSPAGDLHFKNLLLMAPACDFTLFASVLGPPAAFDNLRLFALQETLESGYWEVPAIYPRSLLYLVSGAFEVEAGPRQLGAYDLPLVGMKRYYDRADVYLQEEVEKVRQFLAGDAQRREVWSVDARVDGLGCDAHKHGEFYLDADGRPTQTMKSVQYILSKGW